MRIACLFLLFCGFFFEMNAQSNTVSPPQSVKTPPIPSSVNFAGEVVPLKNPEIKERLEVEIISNTFFHSRTFSVIKLAGRWRSEVEEILKKEGVPVDFFYLAIAESALDNNAGSSAGARGMWQLTEPVALEKGLVIDAYVDQRRDPILSTYAACKHIKELREEFGSWTNAAAAYNRGESGLKRAIENQKVSSYYDLYLNPETARYIFRVLAMKLIVENPQNYGFNIGKDELYPPLKFKEITIDSSIADLPAFAILQKTNYKMLRFYNPWLDPNAKYTLKVYNPKQQYKLRIPLD